MPFQGVSEAFQGFKGIKGISRVSGVFEDLKAFQKVTREFLEVS